MNPQDKRTVIFDGKTEFGRYQIVDTTYVGRPARVLFGGEHRTAQSGIPFDDNPDLLFDYNQRFLELAAHIYPKRVLVIGGGMFTLPMALLSMLQQVVVDVVEIDGDLPLLARRYFGLTDSSRLTIFHDNGRSYLKTCNVLYDLIIIDAFNNAVVPYDLTTLQAAQSLRKVLKREGVIAMNVISAYRGSRSYPLRAQYASFARAFDHVDIFPAGTVVPDEIPQNLLIVGRNNTRQFPENFLRYAALPPVATTAEDLLHDSPE